MSQVKSKSPIRRCVRRDWEQGGKAAFKTKSFTIPEGVEYHPIVDLEDGTFNCDCPDFRFRGRQCKHILRAVANLLRDSGLTMQEHTRLRRLARQNAGLSIEQLARQLRLSPVTVRRYEREGVPFHRLLAWSKACNCSANVLL